MPERGHVRRRRNRWQRGDELQTQLGGDQFFLLYRVKTTLLKLGQHSGAGRRGADAAVLAFLALVAVDQQLLDARVLHVLGDPLQVFEQRGFGVERQGLGFFLGHRNAVAYPGVTDFQIRQRIEGARNLGGVRCVFVLLVFFSDLRRPAGLRHFGGARNEGVAAHAKTHFGTEVTFFGQELRDVTFDDGHVHGAFIVTQLGNVDLHCRWDDRGVRRDLAVVESPGFAFRIHLGKHPGQVRQGFAEQAQGLRGLGKLFVRQVTAIGPVVGDGLVLLTQRLGQGQGFLGIDAVGLAHVHLKVQQRERQWCRRLLLFHTRLDHVCGLHSARISHLSGIRLVDDAVLVINRGISGHHEAALRTTAANGQACRNRVVKRTGVTLVGQIAIHDQPQDRGLNAPH
ncbi:hypothetical protein ALP88_05523 [Pseudomonas savastanoi pv. glycinea]|nr:hypothetical protein ALP88_05523 [Pseudomonas savastanoi pv. glycinea]